MQDIAAAKEVLSDPELYVHMPILKPSFENFRDVDVLVTTTATTH